MTAHDFYPAATVTDENADLSTVQVTMQNTDSKNFRHFISIEEQPSPPRLESQLMSAQAA